MRSSGVLITAVFGFLALVATVWIGRYKPEPAGAGAADSAVISVGPKISETGPYPKAVVDETTYDFGAMLHGGQGEHVFTIRNEGQADLEVIARKEDTTCSCTFGELSDNGKIPPGKSVDVTLKWQVKFNTPTFRHRAVVRTNDPEYKEVELTITGKVEEPLILKPGSPWSVGEMVSDEPSVLEGVLISKLVDAFEIKEVKAESGVATVETTPLSAEELATNEAKSGYKITATIKPTVPVGVVSDNVKITTDIEKGGTFDIVISGTRPGPVELLGPSYTASGSAIRLGEFPASEGKSAVISIFVRNFDEEFQLLGTEQTFNSVQVEMSKDPKATGKVQRYLLKVTVPPGAPQDRLRKKSEKINLLFNHPQAEKVRIYVEFLAV
ncbi:MAG: DUF1573 domain-containing protein [Planctomycetaceae bacterium]|nr:DUF1573 domain-containing protein [Planctomycetaceae bacterium]